MTDKETSKVKLVDEFEDIYDSTDSDEKDELENKPQSAEDKEKAKKKKKYAVLREVLSYVFYLALAFVLAILWKNFVMTKVEVISGSMLDTLQIDDRLVASKLPYIFGKPQRGDIVVFHFPDNEEEVYIKRLIGLPGETVEMKNGYVYIDGVLLEEDYIKGEREGNAGPFEVPEGHYFMLGDNRNSSLDSRVWTNKYVSDKQIIGKAIFRYKPKLGRIYKKK